MAIFSKPMDAQDGCLLLQNLPTELLDEICTLVYTAKTSEDGSIELDRFTQHPTEAFTASC